MNRAAAVTALLVVALAGIGATDFFLKEYPRIAANEPSAGSGTALSSSSAASSVRIIGKGVVRSTEPVVEDILRQGGYTWTEDGSENLLSQIVGGSGVTAWTLLRENDRAMSVSWIESGDVKSIFRALKQSLQETFSADVRDLFDETQRPEEGAPRDILSFIDPAISPERILFARVRTRLYEFRVPEGRESEAEALLNALAQ